jgi:hypothetical protein
MSKTCKIALSTRQRFTVAFAGACGLMLSGGTATTLIFPLLAFTPLIAVRPLLAQSSPGVLLEAGIEKEDVDGDLKSAMDIYQKDRRGQRCSPRGPRQSPVAAGRLR